jgi:hypothetical protein
MNPGRSDKGRYQIAAAPSDPQPDEGNGPPDDGTLKCKADPDKNPKCGGVKTPTKYR